MATLWQSRN